MGCNRKSGGFTLIELLTVIAILLTLFGMVGPEIYKAMQADSIVIGAAKALIADLKSAQNAAISGGGGEMQSGRLVEKSVIVAFPAGTNTYKVYSYADKDGNNARTIDEVTTIVAAQALPRTVKFGTAGVTAPCLGGSGTPPADGLSLANNADADPCRSGAKCLEINGNGFPVGSPPAGGLNIYLTNNYDVDKPDLYEININVAGNFTLCKRPHGASAWTIVR